MYEKVYALLTRVCRGITLLRGVSPEAQRQRVQLVQRGAWQILLAFARRRVCVATFAGAFLDFLRGSLSHAQPLSSDLPQQLLVTVAWVCSSALFTSGTAASGDCVNRMTRQAVTSTPEGV